MDNSGRYARIEILNDLHISQQCTEVYYIAIIIMNNFPH